MATHVSIKQAPQPAPDKANGAGAPAAGNVDQAQQAARAQAMTMIGLVTDRWKTPTQGLFDLDKPVNAAFTPAMFRALAYELLSTGAENGMNVDKVGAVSVDEQKVVYGSLGGDKDRKHYQDAFAEAMTAQQRDTMHLQALGTALDDLMHGGDVKWNTKDLLGHYAPLSNDGKRWVAKAPKTAAFKKYATGSACEEHGAMEATHALAADRQGFMLTMGIQGGVRRKLECRPIMSMLEHGALGAVAVEDKAETKEGAPNAATAGAVALAGAADGAAATTEKARDPIEDKAQELIKEIETAIAKHSTTKHGESTVQKDELKKLIKKIEAADEKVKDRLYAKPELMQTLMQLEPGQMKSVVAKLDTVQGLYETLEQWAPDPPRGPASGMYESTGAAYRGRIPLDEKVYPTIETFLTARPGKDNAAVRMRVLQHEMLKARFIDNCTSEQRAKIYKLVANGTLEPTVMDKLRDAARAGNGVEAARALMKLGNDSPGEFEPLKADHIFRKEIENVDKEVIVDGFTVNAYHLCLTFWGLDPLSTKDATVDERQTEVNLDGKVGADGKILSRPLTIEQKMTLETKLLDPYATSLRAEIHSTVVEDDIMKDICQSYERASANYVAMFRAMGKAPGPALTEYYNKKYPGHDLRGEVNEYVSDSELVECERVLGFRVDSASVGIVNGQVTEHGAQGKNVDDKGKIFCGVAQALRETKDDKGVPLSQITSDYAQNISNWLYEPQGWQPPMMFNVGQALHYPSVNKDEFLKAWGSYSNIITSRKKEIASKTTLGPEQVHAIEFLQNAVMEKGGDLAGKIKRFYGPGVFSKDESADILKEMGLRAEDAKARLQAAESAATGKDPLKNLEQKAKDAYAESSAQLFEAIARLPAPRELPLLTPIAITFKQRIGERLPEAPQSTQPEPAQQAQGAGAPGQSAPPMPKSIEERPPRSFVGYYRLEYGIDPTTHITRVLKSHRDRGTDVTAAAQLFGVEVPQTIEPPPGDELKITDANKALVRPSFTEQIARDVAREIWNAFHEGTRLNIVMTKLYTDFSDEEQRLIRMGFREISGGIDIQFYLQQRLLQKKSGGDLLGHNTSDVTVIGGEATDVGKTHGATDKTEIRTGETDVNELMTAVTAAKEGTLDCYGMMKSAANNRDVDAIMRLADEAEQNDRSKILQDRELMDQLRSACDAVAWDRVYKTLTNQADLVDRLYQRGAGLGTDEKGMREDIKAHVKRLRKRFRKQLQDEDQKKDINQRRSSDDIEKQVGQMVREECQRLMSNISVRRIIEEELSDEELSEVESLIINAGETTTQSEVLREGNDADKIIAGIRNTSVEERARLRGDARYLELLAERLRDPNDYRKAMDALMSSRPGEDVLSKVDENATKDKDRTMLRDLVDLSPTELKQLQADPDMQAKLLATFDDPEKRALARKILSTKLEQPDSKLPPEQQQDQAEVNRVRMLAENARARLRVPVLDKLGWPTMLEECIEVYKMELELRVADMDAATGQRILKSFSEKETQGDRQQREQTAKELRKQIWADVKDEVVGWAYATEKDKPKRTMSEAWTGSAMIDIVRDAVLGKRDPSSERLKENIGATVEMADPYGQGYDFETGKAKTRKVELDNDYDGIKKTISSASDQVLVDEWSNVLNEPHTGGKTLKAVFDEYRAEKKATQAHGELKPTAQAEETLFKKKMAFVNYTLDISTGFEKILLPHVGASDERTSAKELGLGKVTNLKDRDNKKYNELLDLARGRIIKLSKDDARFLIAQRLNVDPSLEADQEDWKLFDNPNRDTVTNFVYRDSKYARSRGTEAGSGWAAHDEAQVLDNRMMQYGHEVAAVQTNEEGGRGLVSKDEAEKTEEKGAEMERALQAFKDAKAKVAFWMSMIIGALVTAILTVLTGGLATGPLAALFFTTAIAGVSAGAKALVNEAVMAEDYDLSDEGVKMIGSEMLTAFITAGTTMLASKAMAGLQGVTKLGGQMKVIEQVKGAQPAIWRGFLQSAGEGAIQAGMQGVVDAGLTAVNPVYWMHGFAEGRDRAIPAMKEQLSAVPMQMLKAGMTSLIISGVAHLGSKKQDLAHLAEEAQHSGRVNVKENFKKVFGNNGTRVLNVFAMWAIDHAGHKVDLENVPAELFQGFLNDLSQQNINVHTESAHEHSRGERAEHDLAKYHDAMTEPERNAFAEMNKRAKPSDPYVTVGDFLNVRNQLARDAAASWVQSHQGTSLTGAQVEAFAKWVREAPDGNTFSKRLEADPESLDTVKKAKNAESEEAYAKAVAHTQVDATGGGGGASSTASAPTSNEHKANEQKVVAPEQTPFPEATSANGEPMNGEEMIAKFGSHKGDKHTAVETHGQQHQQHVGEQPAAPPKQKTAAEVFDGAKPNPGDQWTFVSESGNRYEGEFQGVDETGQIVIKTATGVTGRIEPSRIASARSGVSVPELHEFGPHDRITVYGSSGSARHGTIEGYTPDGNVYFKNEKTGQIEILQAGMLDLQKTQRANEKKIHTEATVAAKLEREKEAEAKKQAEENPTEKAAVEQKATDPAHQEKVAGEAVSTQRDANKPVERDVHKDLPNIEQLTHLDSHVIGAHQASRVEAAVKALPEGDYHAFRALHDSLSGSPIAQAFLLKALAAHNSMADLHWLATEMAFKPNEWLVDNLTLGDPRGVGGGVQQQWSMSCNASTTVTLRGNYDPVFALKMRYSNRDVNRVDFNDPMQLNAHQAQLEAQLLQSPYSGESHPELQGQAGVAVPHAQGANKGRWADDILSAQHDVTGMKFATTKNPPPDVAAATLIRSLKKGMQVPIVIGDYAGAFTHYVLVMQIRNNGGGNEFQIHNTGDGTTTWVTQRQILDGTMGLNGGNKITAMEVPTATPHPDEAAQQAPTDAQAQAQPATDPAHAGASSAATAPPTAATQKMAAVTVADAPAIATTAVAVVTEQLPTSSLATRIDPAAATDPAKGEHKTVEAAAVPPQVQNVVQMILHGKAVNAAHEIQAMEAKAAAVTAQEQAGAKPAQTETSKQPQQQKPGAHDPAYEQFTQDWKGQPADLKQFKEFFDVGYEDALDKVRRAMSDPQVRQLLQHVPEDELAAIVLYTQTYFVEMNSALRGRDKESMKDFGNGIKLADKGLAKMPVHEGWVHRGVESLPADVLAKYVPGVVVTEEAFTSTSQQEDAAFAGKVKFNILSKTGRDVKQLSRVEAEKEVLFRPGTKFIVVDKVRDGDSTIITMEEVSAAPGGAGGPGGANKDAPPRVEPQKELPPDYRKVIAERVSPQAGDYAGQTVDRSSLSQEQSDIERWQTHGLEDVATDPDIGKMPAADQKAADKKARAEKQSATVRQWLGDPEFRHWYDVWMSLPDRVTVDATGEPKVNLPPGVPAHIGEHLKAIAAGGNVALFTRALEVSHRIEAEFPGLDPDPESAAWKQARPRLVEMLGEEQVKKYETERRPEHLSKQQRQAQTERIHELVKPRDLQKIEDLVPGAQIYVTGSGGQMKKATSDVTDLDLLVVVPSDTPQDIRIKLEHVMQSLRVTGGDGVERAVDAKVMTQEQYMGFAMLPTAEGRSAMTNIRIDHHEEAGPGSGGPGGTGGDKERQHPHDTHKGAPGGAKHANAPTHEVGEQVRAHTATLAARHIPDPKTDSADLRSFRRDLYKLLHDLGVHTKSNHEIVAALHAVDPAFASRVEAFLNKIPKNSWGVEEFPKSLADDDPLLVSTDKKTTTPDGQNREAWRKAKVDEILSRDGAKPVTDGKPVLYIMGGGGASGKGTLKELLVADGTIPEQNVVKIDPDEIKGEIPEYQKIIDEGDSRAAAVVHEESSALSKDVLSRAYAERLNIVMDVTLGDPKKGREMLERARGMGYEIRLFGVSVDASTAIERNLSRAKASGRYVPPEEQIKAHKGFSRGFESYADLVDEAQLFDTSGKEPSLMAEKQAGGSLEVTNKAQYDKFQDKGDINLNAKSVDELTDDKTREIVKPETAPTKDAYTKKALENLNKSSRTAQGVVDTSAGADKAKSMADVSGEQAAKATKGNYSAAVGTLYESRSREFSDAGELRGFVEDVAKQILSGVVKEGELIRKHEAKPELPYTKVAQLDAAMNQFYAEFLQRLRNPNEDAVSLAAWVEYRINLTDHFFADGCGKISSAIAAWVLMRQGYDLPDVSSRNVTFANAPLKPRGSDAETDRRQEKTWEKHYRRQFN